VKVVNDTAETSELDSGWLKGQASAQVVYCGMQYVG